MYIHEKLQAFFNLSAWFSPTETLLKMSEEELAKELEKCQDGLYFFNNYTLLGRKHPMTKERWDEAQKKMKEHNRKIAQQRKLLKKNSKGNTND